MRDFTVHPAAALFPAMSEAELQQLADDIRANGLIEPVIVMGNEILDGRNRIAACKLAGVEPDYRDEHPANVYQFVVSMNIHRRHLTTAQRAEIAARMATLEHGGDRKSEKIKGSNDPLIADGPPTIKQAAKLMGISPATVKRAKAKLNPKSTIKRHRANPRRDTWEASTNTERLTAQRIALRLPQRLARLLRGPIGRDLELVAHHARQLDPGRVRAIREAAEFVVQTCNRHITELFVDGPTQP